MEKQREEERIEMEKKREEERILMERKREEERILAIDLVTCNPAQHA